MFVNKNPNYSFEYIVVDFLPSVTPDKLNEQFLKKLGSVFLNKYVLVNGEKYKVVDYQVAKGGIPHHTLTIAFGMNKIF